MATENESKGYLVDDYSITTVDKDGKESKSKLWRVSRIGNAKSQVKLILKDGFASEEDANAFADQCYEEDKKKRGADGR